MRIAFAINSIAAERPRATTTVIAHAAHARGHQVFLLEVGDLTYYPDGHIAARAHSAPAGRFPESESFLEAVRAADATPARITTAELDVLWLRYNPGEYPLEERWATFAGIRLGRLAVDRGVLVLDDPDGIFFAEDKLYLQRFPESVRPRTMVTRRADEVLRFHREGGGRTVLKPLDGYGGEDVYLIREDETNLSTIVESLARRGFVIAQEFLPEAAGGDVRLFVMNGRPLCVDGRYAAIRRVNRSGDFRSNMALGGTAEPVEMDERILRVASRVGPRLRAEGVFLAGLDVVGDKLVEINTLSPGGLHSASQFEGVDFASAVVAAVERKLELKRADPALTNRELASVD